MSHPSDAHRLAEMLESLRAGTMSEEDFRAQCLDPELSRIVGVVWDGLVHYVDDTDTRAKDARYRAMQDSELDKLLALLRSGAPDADLMKIHFLARTR